MNSNTTTPAVLSGENNPLARWHEIARLAQQLPESDPVRQQALDLAGRRIRGWVTQREGQNRTLDAQIGTVDDPDARISQGVSFVQGVGQGASLGLSDELGGLVTAASRLVPGGESPVQGYLRGRDEQRAYNAMAEASNPGTYLAGNLAGGTAASVLGVGGTLRLVPGLASAMRAGATPGASLATKITGAAATGATGVPVAALAGYGTGETGPVADVGGALLNAAIAFPLGAGAGAYGQNVVRRSAVNAANESSAINRSRWWERIAGEGDEVVPSPTGQPRHGRRPMGPRAAGMPGSSAQGRPGSRAGRVVEDAEIIVDEAPVIQPRALPAPPGARNEAVVRAGLRAQFPNLTDAQIDEMVVRTYQQRGGVMPGSVRTSSAPAAPGAAASAPEAAGSPTAALPGSGASPAPRGPRHATQARFDYWQQRTGAPRPESLELPIGDPLTPEWEEMASRWIREANPEDVVAFRDLFAANESQMHPSWVAFLRGLTP